VNYAKRQVGNKVYGGQSSHLPLKLNMSGCHPADLRIVHHPVPGDAAGWFGSGEGMTLAEGHCGDPFARAADLRDALCRAIVFFCFFYTALVFNSKETADNLKKSGAFVPVSVPATRRRATSTRY
jgi:preprotein translocase subunit SecY